MSATLIRSNTCRFTDFRIRPASRFKSAAIPGGGGGGGEGVGNNLLTGLQAYYKFDEASGDALDDVGSLDLTEHGTVAAASGKVTGSRVLTTKGIDFFIHADNAVFDIGTGSKTIAFWIKLGTLPVEGGDVEVIISKWDSSNVGSWQITAFAFDATFKGFELYITADGSSYSPNFPQVYTGLETGKWYCVVMRVSVDDLKCYLDVRAEDGEWFSDFDDYGGSVFDSSAALAIGGQADGTTALGSSLRLSDGAQIDELGLWDRAWTDCERDKFFNNGLGRLKSTFNADPCLGWPDVIIQADDGNWYELNTLELSPGNAILDFGQTPVAPGTNAYLVITNVTDGLKYKFKLYVDEVVTGGYDGSGATAEDETPTIITDVSGRQYELQFITDSGVITHQLVQV